MDSVKHTHFSVIFAFLGIFFTSVSATNYRDCGSRSGIVQDVTVSDCEGLGICSLKRGSTASVAIDFQSLRDTTALKAVVHGYIAALPVSFSPPQPDACVGSNLVCPLQANKVQNYRTEIEIENSYPSVKVDVKWQLKDQNNQDVVCIVIPAQII